jgi:hypothetical protein
LNLISSFITHNLRNTDTELHKASFTITTLTINSNGRFDVSNQGYRSSQGPGAGANGFQGGAYGGQGGTSQFITDTPAASYGSFSAPVNIGSGGGDGNSNRTTNGGGAIILNISGTLTNNGGMYANGDSELIYYQGA